MRSLFTIAAWLLVALPPALASVSVSANSSGSTSPITIYGKASSNYAITGWDIYVDSNLVFRENTSATSITESISMSTGSHNVVVKSWDSSGADGSASLAVSVSGSLIPTPPSTAKSWTNVDDMSGWIGCSACANGTTATYWFKQWVGSPSLDGESMEAYIKGSYGAWADDLFVYKFGDQDWASHVLWTISFLWNAPVTKQSNGNYVVQAMEFDSYFSENGFKYLFGSQCDYAGGHWDIWNNTGRYWQHTSVACQKWAPNTWHTVTWYLKRDPSTKYLDYAVLQVDGTQYSIGAWLPSVATSWGDDFGIQWEQDTDLNGDPWYMWVDKIKATIW